MNDYSKKTLLELINEIIWFDKPFRLKEIFKRLLGVTNDLQEQIDNLSSGSEPSYKVYTAKVTKLNDSSAPVVKVIENTIGSGITVESYYLSNTHLVVKSNGLFDTRSDNVITTYGKGNISPQGAGLFTSILASGDGTSYLISPYTFVYVVTVPSGPQGLGTTVYNQPMYDYILEIRVYN